MKFSRLQPIEQIVQKNNKYWEKAWMGFDINMRY